MDPNATLRELRRLAQAVHDGAVDLSDMESHSFVMADAISAMDEWISKGGFLPEDWDGAVKADLSHVNPAHAQAYGIGMAAMLKRWTLGAEVRVIHEIPHDAYRYDIPDEVPHLRLDLSAPAAEAVEQVASDFDSAVCPMCYVSDDRAEGVVPHESIIGWVLVETDDDGRPGAHAGFYPFWVVEGGGKAWPVCEDCIVPVLDPPIDEEPL